MKLDYYLPSNPSQSLVIQYEHVQAEGENISVIDRHIPSGYASLVFNSSGRAAIHEEPLIHLPQHFMVVPLFRAVNIGIYEDLDLLLSLVKHRSYRNFYLSIFLLLRMTSIADLKMTDSKQ